jgi:quercetin dioxygenase-like cupin family protein
MTSPANPTSPIALSPEIEALPWQPLRPGFSLKLLRGGAHDDDTRVLLLRLEPGTVVARHRHGGEVHALNLAGTRRILESGEVVGPGGYVYEPPGNVDSWMAIGDEPLVIFVTVRGAIEYLDDAGAPTARSTTPSATESYRRFAQAAGG